MTTAHDPLSNYYAGITVHGHPGGTILWDGPWRPTQMTLTMDEVIAMAPVFQALHDAELRRWRSEVHPRYVVYPVSGTSGNVVRVVNENNGVSIQFTRHQELHPEAKFDYAAQAYFNAHKPRKPWQDAKHGEVWELTDTTGAVAAFTMDRRSPEVHEAGVWRNLDTYMSGSSEIIKSAVRIYPKEK